MQHDTKRLFDACHCGDADEVATLLYAGINVNTQDTHGMTPLNWACCHNNAAIAEMLLNAGADPNRPNREGDTPLRFVGLFGTVEFARMLMRAGANGTDELVSACERGGTKLIEFLLSAGVDPSKQSSDESTPLSRACDGGQPGDVMFSPMRPHRLETAAAIVGMLLRAGADSNGPDRSGDPPLNNACRLETAEVVEMPIRAGADVNRAGYFGHTPLISACQHGNKSAVERLLRAGADRHRENDCGDTAVDAAYDTNDVEPDRCGIREILSREYRRDMRTVALGISTQSSPLSLLAGFGHITEFIVAMSLPNAILKKVPELL